MEYACSVTGTCIIKSIYLFLIKADPERRITMQSQAISLPSKPGSVAEIQNALRPYDMIQAMIALYKLYWSPSSGFLAADRSSVY